MKGNRTMLAIRLHQVAASVVFAAVAFSLAPAFAEDAKPPTTAAEHEARAKAYKEQAVQYRKSADEHKQMAAEYAKQHPDQKGGVKNPWNEKMSKHCVMLQKDFEKLATDADKAAEYHSMRAKELQGG
jgi:hypothetical protein